MLSGWSLFLSNAVTERLIVGKISVVYMNEEVKIFLPNQYYFWAMFIMVVKGFTINDM
jgi:hypothetical protein